MDPDDDKGNETEQSITDMNPPSKRLRIASTTTPLTRGGLPTGGSQIPDQNTLNDIPPTGGGPSNTVSRMSGQTNSLSLRPPRHPTGGRMSNTDLIRIYGQTAFNGGNEIVVVNIVRAHNLYNVRREGIMNPRAEMYLEGHNTVLQSRTHFKGGTEPFWNSLIDFRSESDLPQTGNLIIDIYDCVADQERHLIGTAQAPVRDFSRRNLSELHWVNKSLAYQVWTPASGQYHGVIHVTVRKEPED